MPTQNFAEISYNNTLERNKLKLLFDSIISSQIGMLFVVLITFLNLYNHVDQTLLAAWLISAVLFFAARVTLVKLFNTSLKSNKLVYKKWLNYYHLSVVVSALSWSFVGFFLFPNDSLYHQLFLILIIIGINIVSINTIKRGTYALAIFFPLSIIPIIYQSVQYEFIYTMPVISFICIMFIVTFINTTKVHKKSNEYIYLKNIAEKNAFIAKENEEKYRFLFEKSEDPMIVFSKMQFIMANHAAINFFGYDSLEHILSIPSSSLSPTRQPDGLSSLKKVEHINKKLANDGHYRFDWTFKRLNGEKVPADVSSTVIPYEGKKATYIIIRDLLAIKQIEHDLETAKKKAEQANDSKSEFVANMSHEIRTPMNGIIGATDLLIKQKPSPKQLKLAKIIKQSAASMHFILNDILDFSKIEAGKLQIINKKFNLYQLIDEIISSTTNLVKKKNLRFIYPHHSKSFNLWYLGDADRIRQILVNLIDNAIKFTEHGHIIFYCKVIESSNTSNIIQFDVTDSGIGLTELQIERIFNRFIQGDSSTTRLYGGTGLGLSICQQLAELMGGKIRVKSREHKGSNFRLTIKLDRVTNIDVKKHTFTNKLTKFNANILIVDDNEINQTVAAGMVKSFGAKTMIATDGIQALNIIQDHIFDLILMDCQMPNMDGYTATRQIRNNSNKTPIIAMTANAMLGEEEKCINSGMNDYLAKPFDITDLYSKLDFWLSKNLNNLK